MNWVYEGKEIKSHDDLHPECKYFVYLITYSDGKMYIGKKKVRGIRTLPPLKGKKRKRKAEKALPFVNYEGSHGVKDLEISKKEILHQCSTSASATYIEAAYMFEHNVLFREDYLNNNILGKFYNNCLDGLIDTEN